MSNARLRRKLELMSPAIVAAMIDNGDAHDECGILEYSHFAYCNPPVAMRAALDKVHHIAQVPMPAPRERSVRERL